MKEELKKLLADYLEAKKAASAAYDTLRAAAIEATRFSLGDKIRIKGSGGEKVGVITSFKFDINDYLEKPSIDVTPVAYPIKKDGTVAKVGEMRAWDFYGDKIEIIEKAKK